MNKSDAREIRETFEAALEACESLKAAVLKVNDRVKRLEERIKALEGRTVPEPQRTFLPQYLPKYPAIQHFDARYHGDDV